MAFGHKVVAQSGKPGTPSKANADKHVVSGKKSMGMDKAHQPNNPLPKYSKGSKGSRGC